MADLDPLEQLDLLAFENHLLKIRFTEQASALECSGQDQTVVSGLVKALAREYWPDLAGQETRKDALQAETLIELQSKTYTLMRTSAGAMLEIR